VRNPKTEVQRAQPGSGREYLPALDGLRGAAILLVLIVHASVFFNTKTNIDFIVLSLAKLGQYGVDLFLVLSGFLITRILLTTKEEKSFFRNFFVRRSLRIFPLYFAFLFIFLVIFPEFLPQPLAQRVSPNLGGDEPFVWLYLTNVLIWLRGEQLDVMNHLWSLALEEQFYLIWPVVVFFVAKGKLTWISAALMGIAIVARASFWMNESPSTSLSFSPLTRLDGLAVGTALAVFMSGNASRVVKRAWPWVCVVAPCCFVGLEVCRHLWSIEYPREILSFSVVALFCGSLLVAAIHHPIAGGLLSNKALRFLGKYSYAIYLFHWPIFQMAVTWPQRLADYFGSQALGCLVFLILFGGLSVVIAMASWYCFERHFLKLKDYFTSRPPPKPVPISTARPSTVVFSKAA
jgi:peptidoglycan/LPS O-acetylase OafA/YrhL